MGDHDLSPAIRFLSPPKEQMLEERRRVEDALRAAEAKYRSIFENAVEGIFQTSPEGRYLSANPALARMYGYDSPQELMESFNDIARQLYVDPASRQRFVTEMTRCGMVQGFEAQVYRKDGTIVWISESARAVRDDAGKLLYYEGTVENITARKRLEQHLHQNSKMEAIGRLAGGVAHDFNNLLTAIGGYAELILHGLSPAHPLADFAHQIRRNTERAAELTRQLLTFSRQQMVHSRVWNLNEIVYHMQSMLRRLLPENVALETELLREPAGIKVDRGQIEQIILNLVVNARDAMSRGGRITLGVRHVQFTDTFVEEHGILAAGDYTALTVADNGEGMTETTKAHLFEPFFTTKEKGKGTGLGLAIVYGIVQQNGGHITVKSEQGRGTEFVIYFPRIAADVCQAMNDPREPIQFRRGSETILVVEDEPGVRQVATTVLREAGYKVLEARDGVEALNVWEQSNSSIQLIVTDVIMPRMGGWELLKALPTQHRSKIIFMSGYMDDLIVRQGVREGGFPFLQKPFTAQDLACKVGEVLKN